MAIDGRESPLLSALNKLNWERINLDQMHVGTDFSINQIWNYADASLLELTT
jgi:hypothetical protein